MKPGKAKIVALQYTPFEVKGEWDWTVKDETATYLGYDGDLLLYRRDTDGKVGHIVIEDHWRLLPASK